jgi:hypothetical protein
MNAAVQSGMLAPGVLKTKKKSNNAGLLGFTVTSDNASARDLCFGCEYDTAVRTIIVKYSELSQPVGKRKEEENSHADRGALKGTYCAGILL